MKHIVLATGGFGVMKDAYVGYAPRQEGTFWFEVEGPREVADRIAQALKGTVYPTYGLDGVPLCDCCDLVRRMSDGTVVGQRVPVEVYRGGKLSS